MNEEQRDICRKRVQILHYLTILNDYQEMLSQGGSGKFEASFYSKMRTYSILDVAYHLAQKFLILQNTNCSCLGCRKFTFGVIAANLAHCRNGKAKSWKRGHGREDADQVLNPEFHMVADIRRWTTDTQFYTIYPELIEFRLTEDTPSTDLLVRWLERRCLEIEARTGVPDIVENFLNIALELGFGDLSGLKQDVSAYCKLVYECGDAGRSLAQFQEADVLSVVRTLMEEVGSESAVKCMEERVVPYILHSEKYGRCRGRDVFTKYLVEQSSSSLRLVSALLESWKIRNKKTVLESLDLTQEDLVELVGECLSACSGMGEQLLVPAAKLLSCLEEEEVLREQGADEALITLELVQEHLRALETLSFNGVNVTLGEMKRVVVDEKRSEDLITRVVRGACRTSDRTVPLKTVVDWERLFQDLAMLQESCLKLVEKWRLQELFVGGLLASGDPQTIKYVIFFAETKKKSDKSSSLSSRESSHTTMEKLAFEKTVEIVLMVAREYIQGAENSMDPSAELGKLCLSLIGDPRPLVVQEELDLLAALPLLEDCGVRELPVKVIIEENKTLFIEKALKSKKTQYREAKTLLKIGNLLKIDSNDWVRKGKILTLCARMAVSEGDFSVAAKYCKELAKMKYSEAWRVCSDLVFSQKLKDRETSVQLMNFACLYSDSGLLELLLEQCKLEKVSALKEQLGIGDGEENLEKLAVIMNNLRGNLRRRDLQVDPFVQNAADYYAGQSASGSAENSADMQMKTAAVLRILSLESFSDEESRGDERKMEALSLSASLALGESIGWGLGCMLDLGDEWKLAEAAVGPYGKDDFTLEVLLLYYSMKILREADWSLVKSVEPRESIKLAWRFLESERVPESESAQRFRRWMKVLHQYHQAGLLNKVSKDIDVGRFVNEDSYRRDTILGTAMTTSEETYQNGVQLAEEHGIPLWDVQMANLEFLLTDPSVDSSTAQAIVKQHKLVSSLSRDKERLSSELLATVFPLLDGRDHSRLLYYYLIMERGCEGMGEAGDAQTHRSVLRHVMKLLPEVDYCELLSESSDLVDVLWRQLKSGNVQSVAKLLPKIPNKDIKWDAVMAIWAAKLFLERVGQTGANGAWRACEDFVAHLLTEGFLMFVNIVLWRFEVLKQIPMEWRAAAHSCFVFAEKNSERLGEECVRKIGEWEIEIGEQVGGGCGPEVKESKKVLTKEEEAQLGVIESLREGNLSEAGRAAARMFQLHPSLASRSNALDIAKRIKEKHE